MNIKCGEGLSEGNMSDMTVEINKTNIACRFDLKSGNFVGSAEQKYNILPRKLKDTPNGFIVSYDAIIMPKNSGDEGEVSFKIGNETFIWDISNIVLESGNKNTYNITINRKGIDISSTIQPWIAEDARDIEVTQLN